MKVILAPSLFSCVFTSAISATFSVGLGLSLSPHFGLESAQAQITPDRSTATEVNGNAIAPVGSGTVSGGNLYHSFDQFNVPTSGVTFGTGNSTVDGGKINNILNRVTGENPSQVLGTIESRTAFPNANLYLMNPNGVVFGKDARLDIGGSFHVNTGTGLGFAGDRSFSADKANLEFPSGDPQNIKFGISEPAAIINQGNLTVDAGKSITFTAGSVINSGILTAPGGNVAVTAVTGGSVVNLRSPDLVLGLSVAKNAVPTDWNGEIASLPKLAELLTGKVEQGDRVVVKPDGTLAIVATPTNNQLPITNGTTAISGLINTSAANANGGNVGIFGDRVALINSQISATGINGGKVLIGGDLQGNGSVPNAEFTYFDRKSVVDVSALENGDGGLAIVWGDRLTQFFGNILSKGGTINGDGGFVEVSGKENLVYRGNVDTSATNGNFGTLLLDPTNITIISPSTLPAPNNNQLNANVPNAGDPPFAIFFNDDPTNNFIIDNTVLNAATSNIILQARNDINVNAQVNVAAANISFTAQAGNNINVNQNIATNRGAIALLANNGATASSTGSVQFNNIGGIALSSNGGSITLSGVNVNSLSTTVNFRTFSLTGGGSVDLSATGSINLPNSTYVTGVTFGGSGSSGNVNLTANTGSITVGDVIAGTSAPNNSGNGGNVFISAAGNIIATSVDSGISESTATGNAGTIIVNSTIGGTINIGNITSGVVLGSGNGNNTTISTSGAVTLQGIGTGSIGGSGTGGNLKITGGSISANAISAASTGGISGTLELNAVNDITVDYILNLGASRGGDVSITSDSGTVRINSTVPTIAGINLAPCVGSSICTAATSGTAGNITIAGNLSLTNATKLLTTGTPTGGAINLQNANINGTQNLTLDSGNGAINLGNIGTNIGLGTLTVNAGSILANQAIAANSISFTTTGNITTQILDTSITGSGNSGNISLKSTNGNVTFAYLNTSVGTTGNAGNVTIDANGDIRSTSSFAAVGTDIAIGTLTQTGATTSNAGNITLTSANGKIDISTGEVNSSSGNGNGGIVSLKANSDINLRTVATITNTGNGGNVSITSDTGAINFRDIISDARVDGIRSGKVDIKAFRDITNTATTGIAALITKGNGNAIAGDITIESTNGNVAISGDRIDANADSGNAGNIKITSQGNLTINSNIESTANSKNNGNVTLTSNLGTVILNRDISARDITITSATNLTLPKLQTNFSNDSGNITVNSGGQLFLNGNLDTSSTTGTSGSISLTAARDIFANGAILLDGRALGGRDSQPITVTSTTGNITGSGLLDVFTSARNAGSVTFKAANSVLFRDIKTDGSSGMGGNVTIATTIGNITGNSIIATSQGTSTGSGNVSLTAGADIAIALIDANTQDGKAGDISVKTALSSGINGLTSIQANSLTGQGGNITLESGSTLPNAGLTILAGGAIAGSTIDLRTASLLIGGDLIIDSPNSDILLGETSVQPSNFEIRNARNVTLSQRLFAEKVDITNTGILKLTDANTLIETLIFQQQNASEVQLAGEINGTTITFNSPVVLTGNAILTASDFGATQGTIAFNSTLNGGGRDLKLSTNEIDFGNNVSGINALTLAPSSATVNIQLGGTANVAGTFTLTETDLINVQAGGLGSLIIGGDFGAQISIVSPIPTFLQKTIIQAEGFGNTDSPPTISQGSIIASAPVAANGSDTITFIASQNVNISDVINAGKDIIVTSTNANVTTGRLNTATSSALPSGNVTVTASKGSVTVNSIVTQSPNSKAGDVTIQALNNIQTTDSTIINRFGYAIASFAGAGNGGNISLTSDAGAIDVSSGLISTATAAGISGSINFKAFGNIITGAGTTPNPAVASFVTTGGTGTPNSITFTSDNGAINTSLGDIDAGGGAIAFTARNNITTSGVFSRALNGGTIKLESKSGAIDSTAGDLTTTTFSTGTGGTINLIANGNITTRGVFANGNNGNIIIQSKSGSINTSLNDLASTGSNTSITLTALQNIVTKAIFAQGNNSNITITSTSGNVDLSSGFIQTGIDASQTGSGGTLTIKSAGNILAGLIVTPNLSSSVGNAGSISLTSDTGAITFTGISARRANGNGNGGTVNIQANGNITSTGLVFFAGVPSIFSLTTGVFSSGNGGTVTLTSTNGSIDTRSGTVSTSSTNGSGGNIAFTSSTGAIATENLSTSGTTQGGNILIDARTQIDVGRVSSSSSSGSGGNVILDPIGNVTFTTIDATGNTTLGASGGNINIVSTGGNVLGTGQLIDSLGICIGATICTNGTGTVSIQHGITSPFNLNAFLVGGATTNGTFGTINVGGLVIGAIAIPNPAGSFVQGNLTVTPGGIPSTTPIATVPVIEFSGIKESRSEVPRDRSRPTVDTSDVDRDRAGRALEVGDYGSAFDAIESAYISAYENYLGETLTLQVKNIEQLQQELEDVSKLSGSVTTAVYPIIMGDRLELLIIPPKGMSKPFREFVADAKQSAIMPVILEFANNIRDTGSDDYMEQSQQLYNWLVRPYRDRLQALQEQYQKSDLQANPKQSAPKPNSQAAAQLPPTLVFVMDGGLRVIPVAALHDGKRFLIEEYALANLPYLRATRLEKRDRNLNNVLAMGLTESVQGFSALPGVKIEVSTISSQVLKGNSYFDQEFTVDNLQEKRRQGNYGVLHLATHAQFISDDSKGAFIQFWNERLSIDRIPKLRFDSPLIEMLTLSACQTAVGQNLGLGGLAVSSGAKSVLASLWEVSDTGTAPLMIQFYNSFPENITKAIALQRSQIGMISGGVTIKDGKIIGIPNVLPIPLAKGTESDVSIQHPYFWSSFILIGNWL